MALMMPDRRPRDPAPGPTTKGEGPSSTRSSRPPRVATAFVAACTVGNLGCITRPTKLESPTPAAEGGAFDRPFLAPLELTSDPTEDAIVRVVGAVSCSGTLIADDLVLTAHHCVSVRSGPGVVEARDVDPDTLHVELGGDDLPWGDVQVRAIVSPACGYEKGAGDLAILVLGRKLVGMATYPALIDRAPALGESISPWGFGRCAASGGTVRRRSRIGGDVAAVGEGVFEAVASICPGDSGGPVLNTRREVVGVVSAAVMDRDAGTRDVAYFARLDPFEGLFSAARAIADGAEPSELPPYRSCDAIGSPELGSIR